MVASFREPLHESPASAGPDAESRARSRPPWSFGRDETDYDEVDRRLVETFPASDAVARY